MKRIVFTYLLTFIALLPGFSCKEVNNDETLRADCYSAKIVELTCGGTVLQILSDEPIGEPWTDWFGSRKDTVTLQNCVLTAVIPHKKKWDTVYFTFKSVRNFSREGAIFYCDIGGLPHKNINIINLYTDCSPLK